MDDRKSKNKIWLSYAFLCLITFTIIYSPILLSGNMYMYLDIGADTYSSYWPNMAYSANLFKEFKWYDFSLGMGASTAQQISYFMLDPFCWIVFFFEDFAMDTGIFLSLIVKTFVLASAAFAYLAKMNVEKLGLIIGALCITFSGWYIGWGQHYNFATMFVFFVIVLYAFECWLQDKKWITFVLTLAYLAMLTPFFCFSTLLFLGVYFLFRYADIYSYKDIKTFVKLGFKSAGLCLLALGISSIVFFPLISDILGSPRVNSNLSLAQGFSSMLEYLSLAGRLFSNNILGINNPFFGFKNYYECPFMFVSLLFVITIPALFVNLVKGRKKFIRIIVILLTFVFSTTVCVIMNAFSMVAYRWTYIYVPLFCLALAKTIQEIVKAQIDKRILLIGAGVCLSAMLVYAGIIIYHSEKVETAIGITIVGSSILLFIYMLVISFAKGKYFGGVLCLLVVFDLSLNGYVSVNQRSLIQQSSKESMNYFDGSNEMISYLQKKENNFYRIYKRYARNDLDDSMIQHYNSEKLYSSTLSSAYWDLMSEFDLRVKGSNYFCGFEDKQVLRDLTCGKYMFTEEKGNYYGYNLIKELDSGHCIYENTNYINFGVVYDSYISNSNFKKLQPYEKQNILYKACVIDDEYIQYLNNVRQSYYESCELKNVNADIVIHQNDIILTMSEANTHPLIVELISTQPNNVSGSLYYSEISENYNKNNFLLFELKYNEPKYYNLNSLGNKYIKLPDMADKISGITIYQKDMATVDAAVKKLQNSCMNVEIFTDEYIKGTVESSSDGILFLPIMYDKNWTISVDQEELTLAKGNIGFSAIPVGPGKHEIVLKFSPIAVKIGALTSILSIIILMIIVIIETWRRKHAHFAKQIKQT